MSADDWVKIIGAAAAFMSVVIGALGAVYLQVRRTHTLVNSRMDQLLELTQTSGIARGRLEAQQTTENEKGP